MLKKTIIAALLGAGLSAFSADYYVVVPLQGKQALLAGISVALNNTSLPTGMVGVPYQGFDLSQAVQVTGDPAYNSTNVGWSVVAGALPAGLTLNKGVISGTPTAAGEQTFSVRATYKTKTGEQAYKILTFAVTISLASGVLPQGVAGVAYPTYDLKPLLTVTGDPNFNPANVSWGVVSSSLPAGLTLKADGTISGTPTSSGTGTLVARATYKGVNGQQSFQVVTLGITVGLLTATLPQGVVGVAYPGQDLKPLLTVAGDPSFNPANVTWNVVSSTLPAGLTLKADGTISGTPTAASTGSVTARATYKGVNGDQTYQVVTLNIAVSLASATLPDAMEGSAYSYDFKPLVSAAGDPAYSASSVSFALAASSAPPGLGFTAAGVLSGTPTTAITGHPLSVVASYRGKAGTTAYTLKVAPATYAIDYLVVAGGGGGGRYGGGGGAGGLISAATMVTKGSSYTIAVGAGGAGWAGDAQSGGGAANGGNSSAFGVTAMGGGGGGNYSNVEIVNLSSGAAGGSAGGNGANGPGHQGEQSAKAAPASGQGNYGGYQSTGYAAGGGGGGGAGGPGANGAAGGPGGVGGIGMSSSISGAPTYYAGGGGGTGGYIAGPTVAGGLGGGGMGLAIDATSAAIDATPNTGGGGGGGGDNYIAGVWRAGNGGSGIVIIRYTGAQRGTGGTVTSFGGYTIHTFTSAGSYTP